MGCALGEAFADWYGVVVRENDLPTWKRNLEENRLHLFHCGQKCTSDGSIVQGAVHAFLWDITDPASGETHDRVQKTPDAVASAIKSCQVTVNFVDWYAYNGIDHLIWCMERRFPYQMNMERKYGGGEVVETFFPTRDSRHWINQARGNSVDNLSDNFRRLWLVNLYSRRENVGSIPIFRSVLPDEPPPPTEPDQRIPAAVQTSGAEK